MRPARERRRPFALLLAIPQLTKTARPSVLRHGATMHEAPGLYAPRRRRISLRAIAHRTGLHDGRRWPVGWRAARVPRTTDHGTGSLWRGGMGSGSLCARNAIRRLH